MAGFAGPIGSTVTGSTQQGVGRGKDGLTTYVLTRPQVMATAAADAAGIGSAINAANAAASGPTTGIAVAAADELSAATATLFSAYAQEYQAVIKQAGAFHDEFAQTLATAGSAYAEAEAAASGALGALTAPVRALLAPPLTGGAAGGAAAPQAAIANSPMPVAVSLIMGASGTPTPSPAYVARQAATRRDGDLVSS
jgi:hypothetical protein